MISMWLADPEAGDDTREPVAVPFPAGLVITLAALFTLFVGIVPSWLIDATKAALHL
jgi:NADH:ubiquinone oxidoreductase subunit 2 (subunit N)